MNIQELATVIRHQLPIKIFLINNHGYSMIMQTQDQWLDSKYEAANVEKGLAFPDFVKVANAYGFSTSTLDQNTGITEKIRDVLSDESPAFCNVELKPDCRVVPQVKFWRPLEDAEPLLSRDDFFDNMIIEPVDISRKEN
jgi:acetolactate synthase-1/2/3 large subunit